MQGDVVLVTGGSGIVGSYLLRSLAYEFKSLYVTSHRLRPPFGDLVRADLSDDNAAIQILDKVKPNIIVNLASFTDVDGCEKDTKLAISLNRTLPRIISKYIRDSKGKDKNYLLHISTDYVFDGQKGNYDEESVPNPINFYGKSKRWGEVEIVNTLGSDEWCIVRISTPFGSHTEKQTFPIYVINKLIHGEQVSVVVDQYTSPTYCLDLAKILTEIIKRKLTGFIHCAGSSRLSRYEQAVMIADVFGLDSKLVKESYCSEMNWTAGRPRDSSLNVSKASHMLSQKPKDYEQSIRAFARELNDEE